MKKLVLLCMCFTLMLITCTLSIAEEVTIDLSKMETSELTVLYGNVRAELTKRAIATENHVATSNSPILFRNIPWGTSATEFLMAINGQGLKGSISDASYCKSWEFKKDDGTIKSVDQLSDSGYQYKNYSPSTTVATFEVDQIDAYFLFTYDDNEVYTEQDKSSLYSAKYTFKVADGTAAYDILASKLGTLYGEGTKDSNSTGWWSTGGDYHTYTKWTVWYGPDNTGVVLWHEYETYDADSTVKNDKVFLMYGKTDSLITMAELKSAQAREEIEKAISSDDYDGL